MAVAQMGLVRVVVLLLAGLSIGILVSNLIMSSPTVLVGNSVPTVLGHSYIDRPAPPNLPSIPVTEAENIERGIYGGKGDKPHLGGFTSLDQDGVSPRLWKFMMTNWTVRSVVDVGCGKGVSTSFFHTHGAHVLCVEGSHDAVGQSLLPASLVVEHDFSRGPWWPSETYDVLWSVEFLEHVGVQYMHNYLPIFKKAALLFVTHSPWGGWHHVEVHQTEWWIKKLEIFGFTYDKELTDKARRQATLGKQDPLPRKHKANAQHLWLTLMVFRNPEVSSLPRHAHLFYEDGCFKSTEHNKPCDGDDIVPDLMKPLPLTTEQDRQWEQILEASMEPE